MNPVLSVKNLQFRYKGSEAPALKGIDFSVAGGEIFGFLGPSGAGKTTTQKILIGLLPDYEGEISLLGRSLSFWGTELYEYIGVSFELPNHYLKLTALENLRYFQALHSKTTEEPSTVLGWVGLGDDGDKAVGQFSKGMKNRLTLARALLHRPRLLFLDEPTAGLDPGNAHLIKELLLRLKSEGVTIFLTTHNMSVAEELCDQVGFLVDGTLSLVDAPRALKLQYGSRSLRVEWGNREDTQSREFSLHGLSHNDDFLQLLEEPSLQTIHTQETNLEQIFLQVTGRSLQ